METGADCAAITRFLRQGRPDAARRAADDSITTSISWPNFHSGANGDYQEIRAAAPLHPVLANPQAAGGAIRLLPAHPHEGDVSAPKNQGARVIAEPRLPELRQRAPGREYGARAKLNA